MAKRINGALLYLRRVGLTVLRRIRVGADIVWERPQTSIGLTLDTLNFVFDDRTAQTVTVVYDSFGEFSSITNPDPIRWNVGVGTEAASGLFQRSRVITITPLADNTGADRITQQILINFQDMGIGTITVNQGAQPQLSGITLTDSQSTNSAVAGGTLDVDYISAGAVNNTITLTVAGDTDAEWTYTVTGGILSPTDTNTRTLPGQNTVSFNLVENTTTSVRFGTLTVTNARNSSNTFSITIEQTADGQPVLIASAGNASPVIGDTINYTATVTGGDLPIVVTWYSNAELTAVLDTDTITGTNRTVTYSETAGSTMITRYVRAVDTDGDTSNTVTIVVSPTGGTVTIAPIANIAWNTATTALSWTSTNGSNGSYRLVRQGGNASIYGTPTVPVFNAGTNTWTANIVSIADFDTSLTVQRVIRFNLIFTNQGADISAGLIQFTKTPRPEVPCTFPNGAAPTIDFDATTITFTVQHDVLRTNFVLSDPSSTDQDIWTPARLAAATGTAPTTTGISGNITLSDNSVVGAAQYAVRRDITINMGTANSLQTVRMDQIQIQTIT